jgi:hypothetical protein
MLHVYANLSRDTKKEEIIQRADKGKKKERKQKSIIYRAQKSVISGRQMKRCEQRDIGGRERGQRIYVRSTRRAQLEEKARARASSGWRRKKQE